MKLASFSTSSSAGRFSHLGLLVEGDADAGLLIDVTAAARALLASQGLGTCGADRLANALAPASLLAFAQGGARSRALAEEAVAKAVEQGWEHDSSGRPIRHDSATVTLLPAIQRPPLLRDFMAFEKHLLNVFPKLGREIPEQWYERPVYYKGNPASLGAHRQDIAVPSYAERLDLEFELAVIIGRGGADIAEEDALDHVFGYTIYDDFSAREIQAQEMTVGLGPAKGKDFVGGHALGPVVVTADEIDDPYQLAMTGRVNGDVWCEGTSADMHWTFQQMIAYASRSEEIQVGEVFGSGTVGGGSGTEQGRWLSPGDEVELTVERLGTLRNRVVSPPHDTAKR